MFSTSTTARWPAKPAGQPCSSRYHGQVLLVVNTASKCGYTPQYEGPLPTVMPRRLRGLSLLTLLVAGLAGSTHVLAA
ncbi:hypothetical protein C7E17_24495, partial [Stenotrophomonas maltophilia]